MQASLAAAFLQALPRDGLAVAADVSIVVVAIAVVVLAIVVAALLLRVNRVLGDVRQNIGPVAERSRGIAENVEFITRTLRKDVEQLNDSVTALTDRLRLASDRMEERIEDFNALMEVVQDEAEDIFIDTAATVRGVRAGARTMAEGIAVGDDPPLVDGVPEPEASDADSPAGPAPKGAGALAAERG